ncbi:MAG: hypothetical protein ACREN4_07670, partial [Candidatus Dormibacteria bacterium]
MLVALGAFLFLAAWIYAAIDTVRAHNVPFGARLLTAVLLIFLWPIGLVAWAVLVGEGGIRWAVLGLLAVSLVLYSTQFLIACLLVVGLGLVAAGATRRLR